MSLNGDLMHIELDAFTAGVAPDGLKSKREIGILVCFLLDTAPEPLTKEELLDVMLERQLANYFEICACIEALIKIGSIIKIDGQGYLAVSEKGCEAARILYKNLPYTVREKGTAAAMKLITRRRSERDNRVEIAPAEGGCQVLCSVMSGDLPLMTVSLYVPDESYAERVRDKFHDVPQELYRTLLSFLTDEDLTGEDEDLRQTETDEDPLS